MKRKAILTMAMFFCVTPASAVLYNDGGVHVVDTNLGIDEPITIDNESQLIFNEGGIARAIVCQNGQVTMNGGWLHMGFSGWQDSQIDMYEGITSVTFGNPCHLKDQAVARIYGGVMKRGIQTYNTSQCFVYGGELQIGVLAFEQSEITIKGGLISELTAREGSIVISGMGFNHPYGPISDLEGILIGTLDSGNTINCWFHRQDNAGNGNYGTVTLIPEPATLLLLGLGAVMLRRCRQQ